jgi:CubicO group peptidase (beta-lactamase class C family)
MCVTLRDLARFGHLMLNGGGVDGARVTPSAWVAHSRSDNTRLMSDGAFKAAYPRGFYADKWWHTGDERGTFYGVGIYGQYVWIVPDSGLVFAKLSSLPHALEPSMTAEHHRMFRSLTEALG